MSSTRHSALLRWSPLHPPLAPLTSGRQRDDAPAPPVDQGRDAAVLDLRVDDAPLAPLQQG